MLTNDLTPGHRYDQRTLCLEVTQIARGDDPGINLNDAEARIREALHVTLADWNGLALAVQLVAYDQRDHAAFLADEVAREIAAVVGWDCYRVSIPSGDPETPAQVWYTVRVDDIAPGEGVAQRAARKLTTHLLAALGGNLR